MPDSSSGVYTRPSSPTPVTGQGADAPQVNVPIDDMAAALNRRSFRDGRAPMLGNQDFNGYRVTGAGDAVDAQDYVTKAQLEAAIAGVSGVPTGSLIVLTGMQIPAGGYAVANGQALSRVTNAGLYAFAVASGNMAATEGAKTAGQYGPGDGFATFTVPNLYADNGYFIRPISSGRTIGTVQVDELKSHTHTASFAGNAVPDHSHTYPNAQSGGGGNVFGNGTNTSTTGATSLAGGHTPSGTVTVNAGGGSETRPKNIAYPVLIKT
jgi:hypothetical protein